MKRPYTFISTPKSQPPMERSTPLSAKALRFHPAQDKARVDELRANADAVLVGGRLSRRTTQGDR
ncbi:MAG: hypothetical protein IPN96_05515 [Anaerolineales bacterium]|nr:hypothetical protein [Anaerolineales bacterium]